jgi:hypothetical protein
MPAFCIALINGFGPFLSRLRILGVVFIKIAKPYAVCEHRARGKRLSDVHLQGY